MANFIVASVGDWNREIFEERTAARDGNWSFVSSGNELEECLKEISPDYIFFIHWREKVLERIYNKYECVCFHMTDVPYGRGGSPLQNLIIRGHENTFMTALKMTGDMDAGPVYLKRKMGLDGTAEQIYRSAASLSWEMIDEIVRTAPVPVEQEGEVVVFKRRTPDGSEIPGGLSSKELYDYIRMLDAPGYPKAFVVKDGFRLELDKAELVDNEVHARVVIRTK